MITAKEASDIVSGVAFMMNQIERHIRFAANNNHRTTCVVSRETIAEPQRNEVEIEVLQRFTEAGFKISMEFTKEEGDLYGSFNYRIRW